MFVPLTIILSLVSLSLAVGDIPFLGLPCPRGMALDVVSRPERAFQGSRNQDEQAEMHVADVDQKNLHRPLKNGILILFSLLGNWLAISSSCILLFLY